MIKRQVERDMEELEKAEVIPELHAAGAEVSPRTLKQDGRVAWVGAQALGWKSSQAVRGRKSYTCIFKGKQAAHAAGAEARPNLRRERAGPRQATGGHVWGLSCSWR